jgi:O-antigen biosynthesis protein
MLRGHVDHLSSRRLMGWAWESLRPNEPISLIVTNNDLFVTRIIANAYRQDLKKGHIGDGRHAFAVDFLEPLSPFVDNHVRVFCENDGKDIPGSPLLIKQSREFGPNENRYLSELLAGIHDRSIEALIDFLLVEIDKLKQRLADLQCNRIEREIRGIASRNRTGVKPNLDSNLSIGDVRRALVIDEQIPSHKRDAGSSAILSHIASLGRLGYDVSFAPADNIGDFSADLSDLDAVGATYLRPKLYGSIEEIMRRQTQMFDVIYFHRISIASRYMALARHHFPKARLAYNVADLHHLRISRQAIAEDRPELIGLSRRLRLQEYSAAASADAVLTHSTFEAHILRKDVRYANVHVVPWAVSTRPTLVPISQRRGIAFIGSYSHQPNVDAVRWLVSEIMPALQNKAPTIECFLVGTGMPDWLSDICCKNDNISLLGHIEELASVFDRVRLTVAPLSYGAGIKGKVIDSFAAGVPCVCTPLAAEGLNIPASLDSCIAESTEDFVDTIYRIHEQKEFNLELRNSGLDFILTYFCADRVDEAMKKALSI